MESEAEAMTSPFIEKLARAARDFGHTLFYCRHTITLNGRSREMTDAEAKAFDEASAEFWRAADQFWKKLDAALSEKP